MTITTEERKRLLEEALMSQFVIVVDHGPSYNPLTHIPSPRYSFLTILDEGIFINECELRLNASLAYTTKFVSEEHAKGALRLRKRFSPDHVIKALNTAQVMSVEDALQLDMSVYPDPELTEEEQEEILKNTLDSDECAPF